MIGIVYLTKIEVPSKVFHDQAHVIINLEINMMWPYEGLSLLIRYIRKNRKEAAPFFL